MASVAAPPAHPIDLVAGLVKGRVPWSAHSTIVAYVLLGVLVVLTVAMVVVCTRTTHTRTRVQCERGNSA